MLRYLYGLHPLTRFGLNKPSSGGLYKPKYVGGGDWKQHNRTSILKHKRN